MLISKNEDLKKILITKLCCHYWTPEQIAGHLKHQQKELPSVNHETLYTWIYQQPQKQEKLWKFLARHKAKRGLRKSKGGGVSPSIQGRKMPKNVDTKYTFDHWEGNLMSFPKILKAFWSFENAKPCSPKAFVCRAKRTSQ